MSSLLCTDAELWYAQRDSGHALVAKAADLRAMRRRRGGTLVELLVALLLLDMALLSLATAGAATAKRIGDAGRRSRAAIAAANRVERLSAVPCSAATGGAAQLEPGVMEIWSATRVGGNIELSDSVAIAMRPNERIVVRRRVPCR
jgi:hypothetical protein